MIAAIDTSTNTASLALVQDGRLIAEMTWQAGQDHNRTLLPGLQQLVGLSGKKVGDITGVIVAIGPGSFNGLRVGVSAAKGLAFSLEVPLVGVSSLETEAYQHASAGLPVCPIFNAGRGEVATAIFGWQGGTWARLADEHIATPEELAASITGKTLFCGEFLPAVAPRLRELLGERAVLASPLTSRRRAAWLAELGLAKLEAGQQQDPVTLQPVYLRRPSITRPRHR